MIVPPPPQFDIDIKTMLHGTVLIESPFRTYPCTLNQFKGGAFSYVSPGCALHRVSIGRYCSIGDHVTVLSQHPSNSFSSSPVFYKSLFKPPFVANTLMPYENLEDTVIGHDVWIGSNVQIKTGISIGNGAIVGAGSVVTKNVPPFSIVGGTPAKLIRMRFSSEIIFRLETLAWWQYALLDYDLAWNDLETVLASLEALKADQQLRPYVSAYFYLWREKGQILAKHLSEKT
jgi:acetyltransferase-like isoleucine patch superfamily enzyme